MSPFTNNLFYGSWFVPLTTVTLYSKGGYSNQSYDPNIFKCEHGLMHACLATDKIISK